MTREEAIARIKNHKIAHKMNEPRAIYISEALDIAIEALEQQPCEDCISRKVVKEQMIKYGFKAPDMTVTEFVEDCLPSVTPKVSEDCVSREAVKKQFELPFWCRYGCSKCGGHGKGTFNYCPSCGAKMEVTENEDSN